jgi:hypothetical protein
MLTIEDISTSLDETLGNSSFSKLVESKYNFDRPPVKKNLVYMEKRLRLTPRFCNLIHLTL